MKYINNLNELDKELLNVDNFDQFQKSKWYPKFYVYAIENETLPDFKNVKFSSLVSLKIHITNKVGYLEARIYLLNPHKEDNDFDLVLVSSRDKNNKKWVDGFKLVNIVKNDDLK